MLNLGSNPHLMLVLHLPQQVSIDSSRLRRRVHLVCKPEQKPMHVVDPSLPRDPVPSEFVHDHYRLTKRPSRRGHTKKPTQVSSPNIDHMCDPIGIGVENQVVGPHLVIRERAEKAPKLGRLGTVSLWLRFGRHKTSATINVTVRCRRIIGGSV